MALGNRIQQYDEALTPSGNEYYVAAQLNPDIQISGTTFSSNGTLQTITDSGSGFLAAGFYPGLAVRISSANNTIVSMILTAVTADTLTFGGTDGETLASENAGGAWTITAWKTVRVLGSSISGFSIFFVGKEVSVTNYTLVLGDVGKRINTNSVGANLVIVPNSSTVDYPIDTEIEVCQIGPGPTAIVSAVGVVVNSRAGMQLPSRYSYAKLKKRGTNTWDLVMSETQGSGLVASAFGFRGLPQNSQSGNYTCVAADAGKSIVHPLSAGAGHSYTIPSNASVGYEVGTALTFVNMDTNPVTIAATSDTLYFAGPGTTGTRTLAQFGVATALKVTAITWIISGPGLT